MAATPVLMQYMRESDPVGAIFAGAQNRPAEELVTALRKGNHLRKYGRRGKPKTHYFRLSTDDKELIWDSSNGKQRSIALTSVIKVQQGQTTEVFLRDPLPEYEALSLSLIYTEGKHDRKKRSLDLICKNVPEFETWFWGIQLVIAWAQQLEIQQDLAAVAAQEEKFAYQNGQAYSDSSKDEKLQEFKQIAAALQPTPSPSITAKAAPNLQSVPSVTAAAGLAAGPTRHRLSGLLGLPEKREIGDCYIWGDWSDLEGFASSVSAETGALQSCSAPVMVTNTHALDIIQVAVGARHAALLTRGGEVYTWGSGQGGKLGSGTTTGSFYPYQVTRLSGKGTVGVACGHSYTAAVLADGSLYTWGTGLGGQLGLGPSVVSAVWPMRVAAALDSIRVEKVACGPFHAAAISSDGCLFTWGDGMFGKLGHGDHTSCSSPRQVTALADHFVVSVSCGWWHSAAAAAPRSSRPGHSNQPSADMSADANPGTSTSDPGQARDPSRTSMRLSGIANSVTGKASYRSMRSSSMGSNRVAPAPVPAEMGGWLYTWGGDFTWQQRGKRDHHEGCLGLGDLNGRLVPTVVKGEDDIKQVACGLNFTVALTGNGEVLQMGSTGAENSREHNAMWEGARVPVLVSGQMSTHFAEGIACGMSHVAVVATQRGKNNGAASGAAGQVTRLLTWGQGSRGQLGIGESREDHVLPQVVTAVGGRKILYLACGGHYTLAVCEHDARLARRSRESQEIDTLTSPVPSQSNLVSLSGPSRMTLGAAAAAPGATAGSSGGPGSDRGSAARLAAAPGSGGLVLSASFGSLASSVPSSSRGEGGSGGGTDVGRSFVLRKSDRGKLESRHSERGLAVHQSLQFRQGMLHGGASRGANALSRSLDRSTGGLSGLGSTSVGLADSGKGVSFAASPATIFGGDRRSDKGSTHRDKQHGDIDPSLMSLQALAGSSKKSRLAFTKSLKNVVRNDSNNSSNSSRHGWSALSQQQLPKQAVRQGSNMTNSSHRSETDLMTISTNSSLSSMTPSASNQSLMDSRQGESHATDNSSGMITPTGSNAAANDFARQLRYWQERAANMEQQLSRKTHELEQLQRDLGRSSASQQALGRQQQQRVQNVVSAAGAGSNADDAQMRRAHTVDNAAPQQQQQQQAAAVVQRRQSADERQRAPASATGAGPDPAAARSADVPSTPQQSTQQPLKASNAAAATAAAYIVESGSDSEQLGRGTSLAAWVKNRDSSNSSRTTTISASGLPPSAAAADAAAATNGTPQPQPQQRRSRRGRSGSADSFKFAEAFNPSAPTGLEALRDVMSTSSPGSTAAAAAAEVAATSNSTRMMRRTVDVAGQGREVILHDSAFKEMGQHSNEASRVLALFQESQRHRQELAEQQRSPQAAAAALAHPLDLDETSEDVTSGSSLGFFSAFSAMSPFAGSPPAGLSRQQTGSLLARRLQHSSSSAGGPSPTSVVATGSPAAVTAEKPGLAAVAADELQQLREQNRVLQQQLQDMQGRGPQQQQQQPQPSQSLARLPTGVQQLGLPPPLLRGGSGTVPVISLSTGSATMGPGRRHRRTVSVDISSTTAGYLTHEVSPGVYLSLQALDTGMGYELKRVRFAKQIYSAADADAWWAANKATIYAAYNIVELPLDEQQQQRRQSRVSIGSGASQQNLGGAAAGGAAAASRGGSIPSVDVASKRFSISDASSVNSPTYSITGNASTYELDIFQGRSAAAAGSAAGPTAPGSNSTDSLSRLKRGTSLNAVASNSSDPSSPSAQAPQRRLGPSSRQGSMGALAVQTAVEQVMGAARGSSGNISSMVRPSQQQQQQQQPELLPNDLVGSEQQQLVGQDSVRLLTTGTADERHRYSQDTSTDGSAAASTVVSSSGAGDQRRGASSGGGIFRLFSRGGGSGGDSSGA